MDSQPAKRSSRPAAILAILVLAGSAVGIVIYQISQKKKDHFLNLMRRNICRVGILKIFLKKYVKKLPNKV